MIGRATGSNGSLAAVQDSTTLMSAFAGKADDMAARLFYVIAIERRFQSAALWAACKSIQGNVRFVLFIHLVTMLSECSKLPMSAFCCDFNRSMQH